MLWNFKVNGEIFFVEATLLTDAIEVVQAELDVSQGEIEQITHITDDQVIRYKK